MSIPHVTTPFGRGPMTLAMIASQVKAADLKTEAKADKWMLYRALCEAKHLLQLSDRTLAVLHALISFHPKPDLEQGDQLIVFPSNAQLSSRAHGMAEQTVRRHLAALIAGGLILRYDSPNGKRYARKDRAGRIFQAFGFSLAPLLARQDEIRALAAKVHADRQKLQSLKDNLTLTKRDVVKLIETAEQEKMDGPWTEYRKALNDVLDRLPRTVTHEILAATVNEISKLRDKLYKFLISNKKIENLSGNPVQIERHQESHESESKKEEGDFRKSDQDENSSVIRFHKYGRCIGSTVPSHSSVVSLERLQKAGSISLEVILRSCPDIRSYGPDGTIGGWNDLLSASGIVRTMIGIPLPLYEKACSVMGRVNTAIVMACVLQRFDEINSPGAYLHHLTAKAAQGTFDVKRLLDSLEKRERTDPAPA